MITLSHTRVHGAFVTDQGVCYRIWSPRSQSVAVQIIGVEGEVRRTFDLENEADGWFTGEDAEGQAGDLYFYLLDGERQIPDAASRFQPQGVRGPSQVVKQGAFEWRNPRWQSPRKQDLVIYELHIGTFTPEGTFLSAIARLGDLCDLGVNAIEIMPVGAFPGDRNWGYDVVLPFAPANCYGTPDDFRTLVDAAHGKGLTVILDVVYNHVCGEPNWLEATSPFFFHQENGNEWGKCLNFDGEHSAPVREFFLENAIYWMEEFRIDGFRLDAVHAIHDRSPVHILEEITQAVHARHGVVIAEDNANDAGRLRQPRNGGFGMDAVWADDFHHVVKMALKPEPVAHFKSYQGTAAELAETLEHGWLFRGNEFPHWKKPRGTECRDLPPGQFVYCISNHDQAGNRPNGERLNHMVSPTAYRAASMLFLLCPYTPMIFMGQEWAAASPFVFFSNHTGKFGEGVSEGRRREFKQFGAEWPDEVLKTMPDPEQEKSFSLSKLRWEERPEPLHAGILSLYRECLSLRKDDTVLKHRERNRWRVWAEDEVVFLRYSSPLGEERLLVTYLGEGSRNGLINSATTGKDGKWTIHLSSEDPRFEGEDASGFEAGGQRFFFEGPASLLLRSLA